MQYVVLGLLAIFVCVLGYLFYRAALLLYWGMRANRLCLQGKFNESIRACDRGLRAFPGHPGLLFGRGIALRKLGRDDEAMGSYREAICHNPKHYRACYNLGAILRDRDRFIEAAREFEEAVRIRPDYVKAHCNLAIIYEKLGRREDALLHYAQYFLSGGDDPIVRDRARQLGLADNLLPPSRSK